MDRRVYKKITTEKTGGKREWHREIPLCHSLFLLRFSTVVILSLTPGNPLLAYNFTVSWASLRNTTTPSKTSTSTGSDLSIEPASIFLLSWFTISF